MTIGRSNSGAERRSRVSWNVERVPKNLMNCLGRPSRDAGQSRVPAPPHITKGMIRLLGGDKLLISDKLAIVRNSSENESQSVFLQSRAPGGVARLYFAICCPTSHFLFNFDVCL